jgi:hypothetical protein
MILLTLYAQIYWTVWLTVSLRIPTEQAVEGQINMLDAYEVRGCDIEFNLLI